MQRIARGIEMEGIKVKCPQCQKEFLYFSSEYRPFCCERCKLIDLGMWLNEEYRVAVEKAEISDKKEQEET